MKKKPKLDQAYAKIIKSALQGKNIDSLKDDFYKVVSYELGQELKELPKTEQKKIKQEIEKFDAKLATQMQTDIHRDLIDGTYSTSDYKKEEKKLNTQIKRELFDLQKEIENFQNHGKTIVKSNGVTLRHLAESTYSLSDKRKTHHEVKAIQLSNVEYDAPKETLIYDLSVQSVSKNGRHYITSYCFYELNNKDTNKPQVKIKDKKTHAQQEIDMPNSNKTGLSVSCTCEDYLYTFSYANYHTKCHYGDLASNFKKRGEEKNPQVNKGMCRHLLSGIDFLISKKMLT